MTNIKCLVWNAQSLVNKTDNVIQLLTDNYVDIACITETWLSDESSNTTFKIKESGYMIDHTYRSKRGGGVAILWKPSIKVKCNLKNKHYQSFQYKNIVINGVVKLNLICLYRLQEVPISQFMADLEDLLSTQISKSDTVVLTGDFNFHFEKAELKNVEELTNLVSSYGLSQFVIGPSHEQGHTLDLVFANKHELNLPLIHPINLNMSDHFPILFDLPSFKCKNKNSVNSFQFRKIKFIDPVEFSHNLCNSLDHKIDSTDIDSVNFQEHYKLFAECVVDELDKVAPVITRSLSNTSQPPWMDAEYRQERAIRRRLERSWKTSGLTADKLLYVGQRNKCAQLSVSKRSLFYSNLIEKNKGDQRALFNIVSKVLDKQKTSGILPQFNNPKVLANKFNDFYHNKVLKIRNDIRPSKLVRDYRKKFQGIFMESFTPTTVEELSKILKASGIKTCSEDPLPACILKVIINDLLPYICDLVNKSLRTGSVEGIKDSVIVPLLKKSGIDPEVLKNYRPVTNEVFISILTERVVLTRLLSHLSLNNLHSKYQHGYKKFHGTETLLLKLKNDVLCGFENNMATVLLLIDLSAAFDTVDIDKLLDILNHDIGIGGTAFLWFKSFLIGRTQRVKIENSKSDILHVLFGVPQGSVLGPTLFNIYVSSLSLVIQNFGFNTSGYADDNNAYDSFALTFQYHILTKKLPDLLNLINEWMNLYFLKMNPDKTEIIMFVPPNLKDAHTIQGLVTDGNCIRFSSVVKNLGVLVDQHFNMDSHINGSVSYCYKLLSDISKVRNLLSYEHTKMLVHAVISSRLDYCNSLLYNVNKTSIIKYQKVQNAAARLIARRRKRDSVSDVLIDLHWLRVDARIIFKLIVFVYKCFDNMAPQCICELLTVRNAESRLLVYKNYQTTFGRSSFSYIAPKLWNNLPNYIRLSHSLLSFKKQAKFMLFNNYDNFIKAVFKYH